MKIAWVTDSTVFLDEALQGHPDIYTIPMLIMFEGEEYRDGVDLTREEFFLKLEDSKSLPTSSQPSVGTFLELYESLRNQYDAIISVHVSSKLSGTYSTSTQAAKMVDFPIEVIDSKILSLPMGKMIRRGIDLQASGESFETIVHKVREMADDHETYVMIGSLEQLHKGGRMSGAQFFIGSALKIKPILALENGELQTFEKIRTDKKAEQRMIDLFKEALTNNPSIKEVSILYGRIPDLANDWKNKLKAFNQSLKIDVCPLGSVIGVHAGEKTIGISWLTK
ncbi:DegV family protein [Bacillus salitolerans]|uniref:DegV family protein n=1 Tax=Bacillus salitolerans TaxID=1437434 RepID=A0ABW4LTI6_9BACI